MNCELNLIIIYFAQDYLDLPVIGGDSASENDSDEKSSDIVEGDTLWSARGHVSPSNTSWPRVMRVTRGSMS